MSQHRLCSQCPLQAQQPVVLGVQLGMISNRTFSDCLQDSDLRPLTPMDKEPTSWKEAAADRLRGERRWAPAARARGQATALLWLSCCSLGGKGTWSMMDTHSKYTAPYLLKGVLLICKQTLCSVPLE